MNKLIFLLLLTIHFASCQNNESSKQGGTISELLEPKEFLAKLKASNGGQLIDVRTPEEVNAGAIEGSTNIDFNAAEFKEKMAKLDKSKPVFVYCKAGGRSAKAANVCKELGFKEIYDMQGGWDSYSAKK